jgi:nitrogen fixation protein FixH
MMTALFREGERKPLQGLHVLWSMVAFFGVIFAVNGYFLYAALSTHTGLVAQEPYRKGLAYNERIAASERQALLGWTDDVAFEDGRLVVRLRRDEHVPVSGQIAHVVVGRPATVDFDRSIALKETAPGVYTSDAVDLAGGNWVANLDVRASPRDEPTYRARRRLWLR